VTSAQNTRASMLLTSACAPLVIDEVRKQYVAIASGGRKDALDMYQHAPIIRALAARCDTVADIQGYACACVCVIC
jgi:hypothetical protein